MDTVKMGRFLKELRKEKGFTQEQLGELIGVTNKTISRWENGNYIPPIECLEMLSDIYQISINEMVAGECVAEEKIKEIAEENISSVIKDLQNENQKFENRMIAILLVSTLLAMTILFLLPLDSVKNILIFIMVIVLVFITNTLNIVALVAKKGEWW